MLWPAVRVAEDDMTQLRQLATVLVFGPGRRRYKVRVLEVPLWRAAWRWLCGRGWRRIEAVAVRVV